MKKFIKALGVIFLSILLFLLIPEIADWISTGNFQITMKDLRTAIFVGTFTPVVLYFSKRIKDDKIYVLVLVLVVVVLISLLSLLK
jgi:competence protein ComGC